MTYTSSDDSWLTTNENGDETGFWRYDAYGTPATGTPTSPFGYAGQYLDSATGLSNMRARWYETQSGSFTTRDPAFAQTDTAYTYASGDPVDRSDPTGQFSCAWINGVPSSRLSLGELEDVCNTERNLDSIQAGNAPNFYNDLFTVAQDFGVFGEYTWSFAYFDQNVYEALVACYESGFNLHATDGQYLGWYQVNTSDMSQANTSLSLYWNGGRAYDGIYYPNWFWQIWVGEYYIYHRYGTPQNAWNHELAWGWY